MNRSQAVFAEVMSLVFLLAVCTWPQLASADAGATTQPSAAEKGVSPDQFDANHDGQLDRTEAEAYFRALEARKITINIDTDHDGRISREEFEAYNKAFDAELKDRVDIDLAKYDQQRSASRQMTVRELKQSYTPIPAAAKDKGAEPALQFLLRSTAEDMDVTFDKANPSSYSYSHDFDGQADSWSAKGVVGVRYAESGAINYSVTVSAAFDHVTNNKDASKETNSLIPRIQGGLILPGDANVIQLHQFRLDGAYATDFDVRSKVPSAEFEYEPTIFALAAGVSHPFFNIFDYRWRFIGHCEYGRVVDAGGKPDLLKMEDSEFLRLGPKLQLEIWPSPAALSRLSFVFGYTHLNDVLNDSDSTDLFTATAKYQLDEAGNFFLTLDYRNGQTPLVHDNTNVFTAGLGVKF